MAFLFPEEPYHDDPEEERTLPAFRFERGSGNRNRNATVPIFRVPSPAVDGSVGNSGTGTTGTGTPDRRGVW